MSGCSHSCDSSIHGTTKHAGAVSLSAVAHHTLPSPLLAPLQGSSSWHAVHMCRKRLAKMLGTMRERLSAKLGNNNDNAFKLRKLFKMYDKRDEGMVGVG